MANSNITRTPSITESKMMANQMFLQQQYQHHGNHGRCISSRSRKHHLPVDEQSHQDRTDERLAKRTRFSPTSTLVVTPPKSEKDIQSTWYTKAEIGQFKCNIRKTTQALRETRTAKAMKHMAYAIATNSNENSGSESDIHFHGVEHIRGIEHLLSQDVLKVLVGRRRMNILKVLREQELQKNMGERDPSAILRSVSESHSSFTTEWCRQVANMH